MKLGRLGAVLCAALVTIGVLAAPASAHATLVESTPAQSAVLLEPPKAVTLTFNESVDASLGAVRVYDEKSQRVDHGGATSSGRVVTLSLPKLDDGIYVVTWRVVSSDSHPVNGSFAFQVGSAGNAASSDVQSLVRRLAEREGGGGALIGTVYEYARWLVFAGLALLIGTVAFLVLAWPAGRSSARAMRLAWTGWLTTFAASLAGLLVYGAYAAGLGLGDIFDNSLLGSTVENRLGVVWLVRLAILAAVIPLLRALRTPDEREIAPLSRWWSAGAVAAVVALASTPGLSGHAVTGDWTGFAVLADTLHVIAMAVWLGGLVVLAVALLPRRSVDEIKVVLRRWTRIAMACVAMIVATGAFQTWRQVGSLDALRETEFGKILIVKLIIFSVMVLLAAFSREVVLRLTAPPEPVVREREPALVSGGSDDVPQPHEQELDEFDEAEYEAYELRRLRRSVWGEALAGVAILVVTALLVNTVPAKTAAGGATGGTAVVTMRSEDVWVSVVVSPGRRGANDVHVSTLQPDGAVKDVVDLTMTISYPDKGVTLDVPLRDLGPGHFLSPGLTIPFPGTWKITAKPVLTEFDQVTVTGDVEIKS